MSGTGKVTPAARAVTFTKEELDSLISCLKYVAKKDGKKGFNKEELQEAVQELKVTEGRRKLLGENAAVTSQSILKLMGSLERILKKMSKNEVVKGCGVTASAPPQCRCSVDMAAASLTAVDEGADIVIKDVAFERKDGIRSLEYLFRARCDDEFFRKCYGLKGKKLSF